MELGTQPAQPAARTESAGMETGTGIEMTVQEINAQITITAQYDDKINISIYDKDSVTTFLEMTMTREQFINAVMNRLAHTSVAIAKVVNLENVGKLRESTPVIIELPDDFVTYDKRAYEIASECAKRQCPDGWLPVLYFNSQNTFFEKDGKNYARTSMIRWVSK